VINLVEPSGAVNIWSSGLDTDFVLRIASTLIRRSTNAPGWDVPAGETDLQLFHEGWNAGAAQRTIRWGPPGLVNELSIVSGVPDLAMGSWISSGGGPDMFDIRGAVAVGAELETVAALVWSPEPNVLVRLGIHGTIDEALELARTMHTASPAEWDRITTPDTASGECGMFC
jgi:hypothetical protein